VISGAFAVFRKEAVVEVGGYIPGHPGEDMELVVRLHRRFKEEGKPCRIVFLPDPVCWTQVPEDLSSLLRQRDRWQRGLLRSLWEHRVMLFRPRYGVVGWLGLPFFLFFEGLGPLIEAAGLVWLAILYFSGLLSVEFLRAYFLLAIVYGWLLSLSAVILDDLLFRRYERARDLLKLVLLSPWEYLGYHQLLALGRVGALFRLAENRWGKPLRKPVELGDKEMPERTRMTTPSRGSF